MITILYDDIYDDNYMMTILYDDDYYMILYIWWYDDY